MSLGLFSGVGGLGSEFFVCKCFGGLSCPGKSVRVCVHISMQDDKSQHYSVTMGHPG